MSDLDYMQLALEEARLARDEGEVPVGAVLVRNGTVIARAHNRTEALRDPTAHAELLCLREGLARLGGKYLSDCKLYVTLEPCPMCAGAMVNLRLGMLFYGAFDTRCGCCGSLFDLVTDTFYHSVPTVGGMAEEECAALLKDFFAQKR